MQYRQDRNGNALSILGYGCMRFTKKGGGIDVSKAEKELLAAFRAGINYFDTAYIYSGSEAAVGEIFACNHIRDKVNIATKLPQYLIGSRAALSAEHPFREKLPEADRALRPLPYKIAIQAARGFMFRKAAK